VQRRTILTTYPNALLDDNSVHDPQLHLALIVANNSIVYRFDIGNFVVLNIGCNRNFLS
jgi:hypothetical protein